MSDQAASENGSGESLWDLRIGDVVGNYEGSSVVEDDAEFQEGEGEVSGDGEDEEEVEGWPTTPEERDEAIRRIVAAVKDCSGVDESETSQAVERIRGGYYPDFAFQRLAVDILAKCALSQVRPLVAKHHKQPYERYPSTAKRLEAVIESLRRSKNNAKMALDALYPDRLCDAPGKLVKTKANNKKLNARRDQEVKAGKLALKKREASGHADDSGVALGETVEVTRLKRRTPAKRPGTPLLKVSSSKKAKTGQRLGPETRGGLTPETPTRSKPQRPSRRPTILPSGADEEESLMLTGPLPITPTRPAIAHASNLASLPPPHNVRNDTLEAYYQDYSLSDLESYVQCHGRSASNAITFELSRRYQEVLFRLLGVSSLPDMTLGQLRLYARAFYAPMQNTAWYHRELPAEFVAGMGPLVYTRQGSQNHIANTLLFLRPIALARGDIFQDDTWNPVVHFIPLPLTVEEQRAMGLLNNPLDEGLDFLGQDGLDAQDPR